MTDWSELWHEHQNQKFPTGLGDEVDVADLADINGAIAGCVSTFILSYEKLDTKRIKILSNCVKDLEKIVQKLNGENKEYFVRLLKLGKLVLKQVKNDS